MATAPRTGAAAVAVAVAGARREHRQQPSGGDRPSVRLRPRQPVALPADVAQLGVAVDGADGQQVDHRLLAALVGELEVGAAAQRVVGAGIDADAAQDAAALVHLVLLEHARLGHQGARGAGLGAAAARDAGRRVEAHVEGRRDQGVEAGAHEVVAGGAHDLLAHVRAAAAVDAARRLAQDEGVAVVPDVVVVGAREAVLGHAPEAGPVARRLERLEGGAVLDALASQVAVADGLAGALEAAGRTRPSPPAGCTGSRTRCSSCCAPRRASP